MSIDWDGYEIYHPGVAAPLQTVPRPEARQAYARCLQTKPERIGMLCRLVKATGVELGHSDAAIQDLNDWFFANVEPDPAHPGRLLPDWYSVAHDVGLFLGGVMIERHPNLRWEFFTWGKKNVSYQRHVIMGFSTEDPKFHTNIDIDRMVATYGHRIVAKRRSVASYGTVTDRGAEVAAGRRTRDAGGNSASGRLVGGRHRVIATSSLVADRQSLAATVGERAGTAGRPTRAAVRVWASEHELGGAGPKVVVSAAVAPKPRRAIDDPKVEAGRERVVVRAGPWRDHRDRSGRGSAAGHHRVRGRVLVQHCQPEVRCRDEWPHQQSSGSTGGENLSESRAVGESEFSDGQTDRVCSLSRGELEGFRLEQ